jgi:hypothetical protein
VGDIAKGHATRRPLAGASLGVCIFGEVIRHELGGCRVRATLVEVPVW